MLKITNDKILPATRALNELAEQKLRARLSVRVARIKRRLGEAWDDVLEDRDELVQKYLPSGKDAFQKDDDIPAELQEELEELSALQTEVPADPIPVEMLERDPDLRMSANAMGMLEDAGIIVVGS